MFIKRRSKIKRRNKNTVDCRIVIDFKKILNFEIPVIGMEDVQGCNSLHVS